MSNGSRSCPTVTLPFGVFAGTNTIDPLDPTQFPAADPAPGLEQYIIDNAPTDATPLDGFDTAFAETVGFVDALDAALGALAGELLLAFAEADTIDPAPVGDTVAGFTSSLDVSSTSLDNLGTLLTGAGQPTPTPGGGGGGGASSSTFDFVSVGPLGQFCEYTLTYNNNTGKTDTVTKFTLENDSAGVFAVTWPLPITLADQASVDVVVRVTATQVGKHTAKFSTFTSNEADPFVVTFTVNVVDTFVQCQGGAPPAGGGGGGGGGGGRFK